MVQESASPTNGGKSATEYIDDKIPSTLSREDAADLQWYFRRGGPAAFLRSNMGAVLAHQARRGFCADPCETCGGNVEQARAGTGYVPTDQRAYDRAFKAELEQWEAMELTPPSDYPMPMVGSPKPCPDCEGTGWRIKHLKRYRSWPTQPCSDPEFWDDWSDTRVTAWPTGSSKHGAEAAASVDEVDAARIGVTGRRLAQLLEHDQRAVVVLDAYFGDEGGQLIHVYPVVPAGRKLLKRAGEATKGREDSGLSVAQIIETELIAQKTAFDATRQALLNAAHDQAQEAFEAACQSWNMVVHGVEIAAAVAAERASLVHRLVGREKRSNGQRSAQ